MPKIWDKLRGHLQEYVARYATLLTAILVPLSGWLGTEGAKLGGIHNGIGKAMLATSAALGTAAAAVTFLRNLGVWQMLDQFGSAPGVGVASPSNLPPGPPSEIDVAAAAGLPDDEDLGAEAEAGLPTSPDIDRADEPLADGDLPPEPKA